MIAKQEQVSFVHVYIQFYIFYNMAKETCKGIERCFLQFVKALFHGKQVK